MEVSQNFLDPKDKAKPILIDTANIVENNFHTVILLHRNDVKTVFSVARRTVVLSTIPVAVPALMLPQEQLQRVRGLGLLAKGQLSSSGNIPVSPKIEVEWVLNPVWCLLMLKEYLTTLIGTDLSAENLEDVGVFTCALPSSCALIVYAGIIRFAIWLCICACRTAM